jgi:hypothetical protein
MKIIIIPSICLLLVVIFFLFRKYKIKLFTFSGIEEWTKKYDRLLGLLVSISLVVITGYYAYITHSMLSLSNQQIKMNRELIEQSEKQFKLSQNPIIVTRFLDSNCTGIKLHRLGGPYEVYGILPQSDEEFKKLKCKNNFPFGEYNIISYKFEISNFSNATAMDIKFNVNMGTIFKDGRKVKIRSYKDDRDHSRGFLRKSMDGKEKIHNYKGDGNPSPQEKYEFYNHIPYLKPNQTDTVQVLINGTDFLRLLGFEPTENVSDMDLDLYQKLISKKKEQYFDIQCTYTNTINQKFKTTGKITCVLGFSPERQYSVHRFGYSDSFNDLEASAIELPEYKKLNSEIMGEKETAKAYDEYR